MNVLRLILACLIAPLAWRFVRYRGAWTYWENGITGRRRAVWMRGGWSPVDRDFIRAGDEIDGPRGMEVL